mgnify:CR=1 FL=1
MATRKTTEEELLAHLRATVKEAEDLLGEASKVGADKAQELQARAKAALASVQSTLAHQKDEVIQRGKEAADVADAYVHDNPWRTIGAVSAVALLLGIIIGRK